MIYDIEKLRKREVNELNASLGGKYSWLERLSRGGIGSPMMYYFGGWDQVDLLNKNSSDEVRVNIEELRNGYFFRFTERTRTYFAPVLKADLLSTEMVLEKEKARLTFYFNNKPSLITWFHLSRVDEISLYLEKSEIDQKLVTTGD